MATNPQCLSKECIDSVAKHDLICFHFETTGVNPHTFEIEGVGVATSNGEWYLRGDSGKELLQSLATDKSKILVSHDSSVGIKWLKYRWGIDPICRIGCTMMMLHLLDETYKEYSLEHAVSRFFDHELATYADVLETEGGLFIDGGVMESYATDHVKYTLKLYNALMPYIKKQGMEKALWEIEVPTRTAIAEMEWNGIYVNPVTLSDIRRATHAKLDATAEKIYSLTGRRLLLSSPQKVSQLLFGEERQGWLGFNPKGVSEKGVGGCFKTGAKELTRLIRIVKNTPKWLSSKQLECSDVPSLILEYRGYSKLIDSFTDPISMRVRDSADGKLYAEIGQVNTVTGRLACSNPNLQQQPPAIRSIFEPDPGKIFLDFDYSQVELRVLAHLSMDEKMMEVFNTGGDIHTKTQEELGLPCRKSSKTVNFGIAYGMEAKTLADRLDMPVCDAKRFMKLFFEKYSGVTAYKTYLDGRMVSGYPLDLLGGRYRRVRYTKGCKDWEHQSAFRKYFNSAIQGSAGNIMKIATRDLLRYRIKESIDIDMLLQVHDEYIFQMDIDGPVYRTYLGITSVMENVLKLRVPIVADGAIGNRWVKAMCCPSLCGKYKDDEINLRENVVIENKKVYSDCCKSFICNW